MAKEVSIMRDFLRGTLGRLLQLLLTGLSIIFILAGLISCAIGGTGQTVTGWVLFILGLVFASAVFGIRYWLGHIVRLR